MNRFQRLLFILGSVLFLTTCGSSNTNWQEGISEAHEIESEPRPEREATLEQAEVVASCITEEKQLYITYMPQLEKMLVKNELRMGNCEQYQEFVSSIYLFQHDYHGWLQADYDESGIAFIQMKIVYGKSEEPADDKQNFTARILEDGSYWMTYESTYEEKYDLPDYVVNEDILRYSRADYVYDDVVNVEEQKKENEKQIMQALAEDILGTEKEYWCYQGKVYQIDRENLQFIDVTENMGGLIVAFFAQQPERIACRIKVNESVMAEVQQWKPKGYSLLYNWNNIAVMDLNKDGMDDYVMALYPDDYEEVHRYEGFNPYELSSKYYAASFWLLLSTENKKYEQIELSNTVEYRDDALRLTEVSFVKENLLQLEYFIGRSPFADAIIQFQYDEEQKGFYVYRSYYRNYDGVLIGDIENYGNTSMLFYFEHVQHYGENQCENTKEAVSLTDNMKLKYYFGCFQYRCINLLEEHRINSLIWDKEYELTQELQKRYRDNELTFDIWTQSVLFSEHVISGQIDVSGSVVSNNEKYYIEGFRYPVTIDKRSGECVYITEHIDKDSFQQIFRDWKSEKRNRDEIVWSDIKGCENAIMNYWETAEQTDNYINNPEEILYLQIVQEGIKIGVWDEEKEKIEYFIIDKEYFLDTDLWEYLKPEWVS